MPDHWGYVVAAYGLAAAVLSAYWRRLIRIERALAAREHAGPNRSGRHLVSDQPTHGVPPASRAPLQ